MADYQLARGDVGVHVKRLSPGVLDIGGVSTGTFTAHHAVVEAL